MVVLDAHSDEVGLMVQYVHPNGLLQIVPLGGWAPGVLPGQTVRVRRRDGGFVRGVIASVPPHFATSAKPGDASDCRIDVGASSIRDVEALGIGVGAPVEPDTAFSYDEARGLCFGKAFDCRVGCAAVLETLRRLQGETLAVDVVGVLSSQEEVGERGAMAAAYAVHPRAVLCSKGRRPTIRLRPIMPGRLCWVKGPCCAIWTAA